MTPNSSTPCQVNRENNVLVAILVATCEASLVPTCQGRELRCYDATMVGTPELVGEEVSVYMATELDVSSLEVIQSELHDHN